MCSESAFNLNPS